MSNFLVLDFFFLVYLFMGILLFNKPYYEMTLRVNLVSQHVGYTSYLKTTSKLKSQFLLLSIFHATIRVVCDHMETLLSR